MTRNGIIITVIVIAALVGVTYLVMNNSNSTNTAPTTTDTTGTTNNPPVTTTPPATPIAGAPKVTINDNAAPTNSTVVLSGSINPNGAQTSFHYEYGKAVSTDTKTSVQIIGSGFNVIPATGYITGLAPSTLYYYRLSATNSLGTTNSEIKTFTTSATTPPPQVSDAPVVSTVAANNTTRTSTNLNGTVNPKGSPTSYWFEYGTTNLLGNATSIKSAGNGTTAQPFSVTLNDLKPSTKYFFRINAQNDFGTVNGGINDFTTDGPAATTKPSVTVALATSVGAKSATLHGSVTPNGDDTTYWFEYSTASLVGSVLGTATPEQTLDGNSAKTDVSASINDLAPNTKYNYRLAAKNSQGTVRSEVMSFTTNGN